ncbi:MAG: NAD(P)/FAD-dependent oxidoreductase [Pirellulales bacterium]|nr:NAD(P)/FAD-dependent oxidoreductase [Pirellulales bacterium]
MYDTIIIGAGMSGLAAGVRLAHFGKKVCILERHAAIGGLNSFYRQRGRTFDVGLHAVTNYAAKGARSGPLAKLFRQLRFAWDEWALAPQLGSVIMFPTAALRFSNDFSLLESEVRCRFPRQTDNFRRLIASLHDYDQFGASGADRSARRVVSEIISDPLLIEMIFCPVLFYGGSRENDIDFDQFSILFRSIFLEGLARPLAGVQRILTLLARRFKEQGGELRLKAGAARIVVDGDQARKVVLEDGSELESRYVLSSAGWTETMRLCDDRPADEPPSPGRISVVESISVLDSQPRALGHEQTIIFFNDSDVFHYEKPDGLVDLRSGTICSPNNFAYPEPLEEGVLRITALANYDRWAALDAESYRLAKEEQRERLLESAARFVPDFRPSVIGGDMFTPLTIRRFTGHAEGAVYGSAAKRRDGASHLKNLFICGNDQGLVGIVGAIISGIGIANRYLLK